MPSQTEEGIFARIPLNDVTLAEARDLTEDDGVFFEASMPAILFHYSQIALEDYWSLTVGDHRRLFDWLVLKGLVADGVQETDG